MEEDKLNKAIDLLKSEIEIYDQYYCLATSQALKIVLNELDRLQKENESKEKAYNDCYCEYKHYKQYESIPKQVVKDKIKEIEEDKECYYYDWFLEELDIEKTINILEELLGDE